MVTVRQKWRDWLWENRTSARMAFILRIVVMGVGALLSLLWTRILVRTMGDSLFGLFLNFQAVSRIGGVGDLGISGAVGIKTGQMLGRGENERLRKLLASARSLFLFLAALHFVVFLLLCPWLPQWLHFKAVEGAGSLPFLFFWAGVTGAIVILSGYLNNLNYAYGTVTWPLLPGVVIGQVFAPLAQWQLARMHAPLWEQNLPYIVSGLILAWLAWKMLKWSHAWLGELRPLEFDRASWKILFSTSTWMYLCSLSTAIYFNTDCLVIGAGSAPGFGPATIPMYQMNYKPCSLLITLIWAASFASLPKITQWIASPQASDRQRLLREVDRLNIFQVALSCGSALGYLAFNDEFIKLWFGPQYQCPLIWQVGFACNLAITGGGDVGIQLAPRTNDAGMKRMGLTAALTAILNLGFALLFLWLGSIAGITFAAVIAQTVLSLTLGYFTCRHLGLSLSRWTAKSWLLPLGIVLTGAALKYCFPGEDLVHIGILVLCYGGLFAAAALLAGLNKEMLRFEIATVREMLKL